MRTHLTTKKILAILVILTVVFMLFVQGLLPVFAVSAPNIISYQGRILTTAGAPVTASSASMIFRLYTASSGGTCMWSNSSASCASATAMTVTLTDGLFSVNLGDTSASFAAIGDSIFADNASVYLDVTINSESLTPRRQIVAAPYALNAENLDGFDSSQTGGTSAFVPVSDANGNLTLTGNPQSTAISGGVLYLNPASADADETIFGVGLGGLGRFLVDEDGDLFTVGDLTVDNAFDLDVDDNTANAFTISEGSTNYLSLTTTNSTEVLALGAGGLTQMTFTTDNNVDNDFNFVGGATFNDDVVISGGAAELFEAVRILTNATDEEGMRINVTASDTTSATTGQFGLSVQNAASTEALDASIIAVNIDDDDAVGAGFALGAGGAGTDFTYGIDLDAANIGTADIRFENSGTLDEAVAGLWTFDRSSAGTVTIVGTDDDTNTALTLSSSGTGTLTLDPTGAGSVALGSTDVVSMTFTTDNNADNDYTFAGGATFNDDVVIAGGAAEVFEIGRTLTNATAENAVVMTVTASDTTSSTSAQFGLVIENASSTEALDALLLLSNADDDDTAAAAFALGSGGSGTDFNFGIDLDAANIGTADIRFENSGTLAEAGVGTWTFDRSTSGVVTITGTDDDSNADLTVSSGGTGILTLDPTGAGSLALGSGDVTSMTFTTDNNADTDYTFAGGATFNDDVVIAAGAGETFEVTRTLTDATTEVAFSLTVTASDTTSSTTSQGALYISNASANEAVDSMITLSNDDGDDTVTSGIQFATGAAIGTDFTYGIDLDAANIGTADIRFENSGTLDESSAGTWTFDRSSAGTVVLQATDDDANTALTVSSSGTGTLTLDPTGAGSIAIGSADVTSITLTTNNDANDDLSFSGGATFNDDFLVVAGTGETSVFTRTFTNATSEQGVAVRSVASDTTSGTTEQYGFFSVNLASTEALDGTIVAQNDDADDTVGAAFLLGAGGAGTDFTYGIDLDAATIGTADIRFENSGTLDEAAAGLWTFDRSTAGTVTIVGTDDDTNTALTLSSSGTGTLTLDPTGAGSIALGSTDVVSMTFTTDNNADNDYTFAGGATFNDDVVIAGGASEVFEIGRTLTNATAENAVVMTVTASDTTSSTAAQFGFVVENASSTEALDALLVLSNADDDDIATAAIALGSGGSGTDFTYGIDLDAANIGTADIRFENSGTLAEAAVGTWTFDRSTSGTVILTATDDNSDADLTINSGGTGILTLDPTGAGSLVFGSADVTSMTFTTDNTADTDFSFAGGATFNDDVVILGGSGEVFELIRTFTDATTETAFNMSVTGSDTTSSTTSQFGLYITNSTSNEAADALFVLDNADSDDTVTSAILFATGGSGIDFSYGIDFDNANIGTADIRFENSGTLDEASAGTWTFDRSSSGVVTLTALDNDTSADLTLLSSGSGALVLDSGSSTVSLGTSDSFTVTGGLTIGDTTGTDTFSFTSAAAVIDAMNLTTDSVTTADALQISADALTLGTGLTVERADGATDFITATGLVYINQANDNSGSGGDALHVVNRGGGSSVGFYLTQNGVNASAADSVSQAAVAIDVNEAAADDPGADEDVFIIRADADGTANTIFNVQLDGDVLYDGTASAPASDVAEVYPSNETLEPGDVVVLDTSSAGKIKKAASAYASNVFGAISTKPALRMGSEFVGYDVALTGRIPLKVSAENGAIAVGDPLTSSSTAGYAMKATQAGMIVGFALEAHSVGLGLIEAFVDAEWFAGNILSTDGSATVLNDQLVLNSLGDASSTTSYGSQVLSFRGSGWDGAQSTTVSMTLAAAVTNGTAATRLSIGNSDGAEVAYVSAEGNFALAGRLYPSDRGVLQTSKYIYYDGSSGAGGDFMRTNASGWATGSYDFAEMFASSEVLVSGDVVIFDGTGASVRRSVTTFDTKLAGVVSTRPGFLAGDNTVGQYPIALAGRVPTNVTNEAGAIAIGDPLTSSSTSGYAMKATTPGPIIGYALEASSVERGSILVFVRAGWYGGEATTTLPGTNNTASQITSVSSVSDLDVVTTRRVESTNGTWSIAEDGTFRTQGLLTTVAKTDAGAEVELYAQSSPEVTVMLSGTATLQSGMATILFEEIDPNFDEIISSTEPIRVFVTPNGPTSPLFVSHRERSGFAVSELGGITNGVSFDWLVIAYRAGFEPALEGVEELESQESEPIEVETSEEIAIEEPAVVEEEMQETNEAEFIVDTSIEPAPLTVVESEVAPAAVVE